MRSVGNRSWAPILLCLLQLSCAKHFAEDFAKGLDEILLDAADASFPFQISVHANRPFFIPGESVSVQADLAHYHTDFISELSPACRPYYSVLDETGSLLAAGDIECPGPDPEFLGRGHDVFWDFDIPLFLNDGEPIGPGFYWVEVTVPLDGLTIPEQETPQPSWPYASARIPIQVVGEDLDFISGVWLSVDFWKFEVKPSFPVYRAGENAEVDLKVLNDKGYDVYGHSENGCWFACELWSYSAGDLPPRRVRTAAGSCSGASEILFMAGKKSEFGEKILIPLQEEDGSALAPGIYEIRGILQLDGPFTEPLDPMSLESRTGLECRASIPIEVR